MSLDKKKKMAAGNQDIEMFSSEALFTPDMFCTRRWNDAFITGICLGF